MKKIILVSLLAAVFSTNVFSSVACSTLTAGYCPDYDGNEKACLAHYQTSGGTCPGLSETASLSECKSKGGSWSPSEFGGTCFCSNIACTYDTSNNECYGNGSQCTSYLPV